MIRRFFLSPLSVLPIMTFLAVVDRLAKIAALTHCAERTELWSGIWCSLEFNRGIAWSFFHSNNDYQFGIVTLFIIALTGFIAYHGYTQWCKGNSVWAHALICVGSLSNIFDRIWYGGVIDFIGVSFAGFDSPILNIADIYITCGALLLLMHYHE